MVRTRVSVSRSSASSWACRRGEAAVAADVEVPAVVGRDDADVLAAGLGALARAAGDAQLDLVRGPQPPVAQLQRDGEADGVLHAVAAPGRADAGLHRAQRLAVGVARLEARVDEPLPDLRQLLDAGAEEVDPLAAGDLRVEPEVLGHLADDDEPLRRDLAAGDAGDDRVRAVLLEVGHDVVVGVLQRRPLALEDVAGAERGEDRADHRLADVAAPAGAVPADDLAERRQALDPDHVEELRPRQLEVLAERVAHLDAGLLQLGGDEALDQREAGAAARACPRARLDAGEVGAARLGHRAADRTGRHVVARAHGRVVGQVAGRSRRRAFGEQVCRGVSRPARAPPSGATRHTHWRRRRGCRRAGCGRRRTSRASCRPRRRGRR